MGLTTSARASIYGSTATRNHQGAWFEAGSLVGTAVGVGIGVANPCAMGTAFQVGYRGIQVMQGVGGTMNAAENWQKGNYGTALLDALGVVGNLVSFLRSCFAAGTPLLTPDGHKNIEDFQVGDALLSRSEFDVNGPVEVKQVEEVFVRTGKILHLHVGGQVIKTTAEHPFWVREKGWVPAGELEVGNWLSSHDGRWVAVEDLLDTEEYQTVYNLRVADWHTYFVGSKGWDWSVWAHNYNQWGQHGTQGHKNTVQALVGKATSEFSGQNRATASNSA